MIIKSVGGRVKPGISRQAAARARVRHTVNYVSKHETLQDASGNDLRFTNMASDAPADAIQTMEAWRTLRPQITDPVRHIVFSPEASDHLLTRDEWQAAIDEYRQARGLGDAPYLAHVELDEHDTGRHPQHLHLVFLRIKSDGEAVPGSWDSSVHRAASRAIESRLGLAVNAGADPTQKFNGRDRHRARDRAAERAGIPAERAHVDPAIVQACIDQAQSKNQLAHLLREQGIQCRFREREGGIYAWSLRNANGPKESCWTSGSKLTTSNEFGWGQVAPQLAANKVAGGEKKVQRLTAVIKRFEPRPGRARVGGLGRSSAASASKKPQTLDQNLDAAMSESLDFLKSLLMQIGHRPRTTFSQEFAKKSLADKLAEAKAILAKDREFARDLAAMPQADLAQQSAQARDDYAQAIDTRDGQDPAKEAQAKARYLAWMQYQEARAGLDACMDAARAAPGARANDAVHEALVAHDQAAVRVRDFETQRRAQDEADITEAKTQTDARAEAKRRADQAIEQQRRQQQQQAQQRAAQQAQQRNR